MSSNKKIAQKLRETAAKLIKQAEMLESGIDPNQCVSMTDTGEPRVRNYPCKGNAIKCANPNVPDIVAEIMTTKKCTPQNCKYFKPANE